jgi:hypothetical protein
MRFGHFITVSVFCRLLAALLFFTGACALEEPAPKGDASASCERVLYHVCDVAKECGAPSEFLHDCLDALEPTCQHVTDGLTPTEEIACIEEIQSQGSGVCQNDPEARTCIEFFTSQAEVP